MTFSTVPPNPPTMANVLPGSPVLSAPAAPTAAGIGGHPNDALHWILPTGRSWQSIASGYVALFAMLIWVLGPVSLGLGIWAWRRAQDGQSHGRGRAGFAIVVGVLSSLGMIWFAAARM